MSRSVPKGDWSKGANNISPADRLPDGFARSIVNADPTPGGKLVMRAGYERLYSGTNVRGVLALGSKLLLADGTDLVEFDTITNSAKVVRTIAGTGRFTGDDLGGKLYFCTENECLMYDGEVKPWGVPDVRIQPTTTVTTGGLIAGLYNVAATYTDPWGREGGTDNPVLLNVPANGGLSVQLPTPPAGHKINLYAGWAQTQTLYLQGTYEAAATVNLTLIRDDLQRLGTHLLREPQPGQLVISHNGVLLIANGGTVWSTAPMRPHLVDRQRRFFQFPADVGAMMSAGAVFVSADKSYALTNVETDTPSQRVVLEFPAIPGTAVILPDGRGAWMTEYGQAITNGESLELVNRTDYTVGQRESGVAGVVENNGNQMVVTATRGGKGPNGLAASDYFFGEILNR